jgi:hypothetical protein
MKKKIANLRSFKTDRKNPKNVTVIKNAANKIGKKNN